MACRDCGRVDLFLEERLACIPCLLDDKRRFGRILASDPFDVFVRDRERYFARGA